MRDAALVAGKDLRIELRSRVATNQVAPFAVLVLILFAFALDPDRGVLTRATPGLFWVAVLFCSLLAVQRSFAVESTDGGRDALRLSGLDPAGIFVGKALAVAASAVLQLILARGCVLLYDAELAGAPAHRHRLLATVALLRGPSSARCRRPAVLYTLLPFWFPASRGSCCRHACMGALSIRAGECWPWLLLLAVFAAVYAGRHRRLACCWET